MGRGPAKIERDRGRAVEAATALGRWALGCSELTSAREALRKGVLTGEVFGRQVQRLLMRALCQSVAEQRGLASEGAEFWPDSVFSVLGEEVFVRAREAVDNVFSSEPITFESLREIHASLLERHPVVDAESGTFELVRAPGHTRRTAGSYYTPASLIECLLDSALEPMLQKAARRADAGAALLEISVCDPACGDGAFLIAAARRMATRLAEARGEKSARQALRDVIRTCLFGVDRDATAADLCKFGLWLAMEDPGTTPASLDGRVKCGNSLVGSSVEGDGREGSKTTRMRDTWCAEKLRGNEAVGQDEVKGLRERHAFFHWGLEFPQVLGADEGGTPGFDVVLGNPPWERLKLQEKEWFALRGPALARASRASLRRAGIAQLAEGDPKLHAAFVDAHELADETIRFARHSGRFPLAARGDVNAAALFVELARQLVRPDGRVGLVVPTGIATDVTHAPLFREIVESGSLVSLWDFENRRGHFPGVDGRYRFSLMTLTGSARPAVTAQFAFALQDVDDLKDGDRPAAMSAEEIARINPSSRTCPIFRTGRDAKIAKAIHARVPVLKHGGIDPWGIRIQTQFHMTNDAGLFRTERQLLQMGFTLRAGHFENESGERWAPILEGKMVGAYDHRAASIALRAGNALRQQQPIATTLDEREDAHHWPKPHVWAPESAAHARAPTDWDREWFIAFKRVTAPTNERTVIACVVPRCALSYTLYAVTCDVAHWVVLPCLLANLQSFVTDYLVRQKTTQPSVPIGVVLETPILPPETYAAPAPWQPSTTLRDWITERALRLSFTSWALAPLARDLGFEDAPFPWDEDERRHLRAELDAAFFHLHGVRRDEAQHILGTFTALARRERRIFGEERTRAETLRCFDGLEGDRGGGENATH